MKQHAQCTILTNKVCCKFKFLLIDGGECTYLASRFLRPTPLICLVIFPKAKPQTPMLPLWSQADNVSPASTHLPAQGIS